MNIRACGCNFQSYYSTVELDGLFILLLEISSTRIIFLVMYLHYYSIPSKPAGEKEAMFSLAVKISDCLQTKLSDSYCSQKSKYEGFMKEG